MAVSKRSLHLNRPPHVLCIVSLFKGTPVAAKRARTLPFTFTYSHAWALRSRLLSRTSRTPSPKQASARYRSLLPCYNIAPDCPCAVDTSFATFFLSSFHTLLSFHRLCPIVTPLSGYERLARPSGKQHSFNFSRWQHSTISILRIPPRTWKPPAISDPHFNNIRFPGALTLNVRN
jgi:hypothetical protein